MKVSNIPAERPWSVVVVSILCATFFGAGIARLEIDSSIQTMMIAGDPAYDAHRKATEVFGTDEILSIAIPIGDALSPDAVRLQVELVHAIENLTGVESVDSLISQSEVFADSGTLSVQILSSVLEEAFDSKSQLEHLRDRVRSHSMWSGWLVSDDLSIIALQVQLENSRESLLKRSETLGQIEAILAASLSERDYYFAGHPFMKLEIARSISGDISRLLPLTVIVMVIVLLLVTRSLVVALAASISILLSVLSMLGAMGWAGLGLTALTNAAPTILLALSTAYFLHFSAAYQSCVNLDAGERVSSALGAVFGATWLAATTTSIGYASLSLSSVPIVQEFGLALSIGVLASAAIGTFFLPAVLSLLKPVANKGAFGRNTRLPRALFVVARVAASAPVTIVIGSLVLGVMTSLLAMQVTVDSSGPNRFPAESRFRRSSEFYRANLSGDVVENVYLDAGVDGFLSPDLLARMLAFCRAAERLPSVDKAISVADIIARMNWVFGGEVGNPFLMPESSNAVAQLLLLYESSGGPSSVEKFLSTERDKARILLKADVRSSSESAQLKADLENLSREFFTVESHEFSVLSTEILLSRASDVIAREQLWSAMLALFLILLIVGCVLRSFRSAMMLALPNLLPLSVCIGGMAMLSVSLSDATSIIAATSIGIAVDSSVHLLIVFRRRELESGSARVGVLSALVTAGKPVVVSSLVVVLGFSILLLSDFQSVAELGGLTALVMIGCLLADLFVLPAQLVLFSDRQGQADVALVECGGSVFVGDVRPLTNECFSIAGCSPRDKREAIAIADRIHWLATGMTRENVEIVWRENESFGQVRG